MKRAEGSLCDRTLEVLDLRAQRFRSLLQFCPLLFNVKIETDVKVRDILPEVVEPFRHLIRVAVVFILETSLSMRSSSHKQAKRTYNELLQLYDRILPILIRNDALDHIKEHQVEP